LEVVREATASFGRLDRSPLRSGVTEEVLRRVVDVAAMHRVAGCVGPVLRRTGVALPDSVADAFDVERRANAWVHTIALRSLARISSEFDGRSIRWAVFKGPVLASHHYRDVGARAYGDIDVFVHPSDLADATGLLEALGYEHAIRNWPLARWFEAGEFQMHGHASELDVHWHPLYAWYNRLDVRIDLDGLFERRRTVSLGSVDVPTFDAVDTLVLLAVHASKSGSHRLVWLKDLERVVVSDRPDLDDVVRRSHAWGVAPRVGLPLARAAAHVDAVVPAAMIDELVPRTMRLVDRCVTAISPPLADHDRDTLARRWSRSARSTPTATVTDVLRRGKVALARSTSRPGDEGADAQERARFLSEVGGGGAGDGQPGCAYTVRRIRPWDRAAVIRRLEELEPRATSVVGALLASRLPRASLVLDGAGSWAGVYATQRMAFDTWRGSVLLLDARAAPTMGRLVDRGPATTVKGLVADIAPMLSLVTRARSLAKLPRFVAEHPIGGILGPPGPETRRASAADLEQLVALYGRYDLAMVPTEWQLRTYLRRLLRRGIVVVYEADGVVVGSVVIDPITRLYCEGNRMMVRRDRRREGIAWELLKRGAAIADELGRGGTGELAPTNPMSLDDERVRWSTTDEQDHTAVLYLSPMRRFRGHARLRRAYESIRPVGAPVEGIFRNPNDPDAPFDPADWPTQR
jgi:hypothetical protein